ncbi:MAG: SurA N-terminal domain-containing protein [Rhodocyclaceae bacterium]|nr:SurA N-terminal domain-containing protein [Rhodocyclaceae bacterium]
MFDAIRSNRRIVQVILGLIVVTFAFFGVESYLSGIGNDTSLATVGDSKIGPAEFENALRRQQDQIRAQAGGEIDIAQLNTPAIRQAVLEGLVNQRLLALYAADARLAVSPEQLRDVIGSIDEFKRDGAFSRAQYEQVLRSQGMSEPAFEAQLRRDVAFQQLTTAVSSSAIAPTATARSLLQLQLEERSIALARVSAEELADSVTVTDDEVAQYYEANKAAFKLPARVKVSYLVLDRDSFTRSIEVDPAKVRQWYDEHQDRYRRPEERRASHVLIELPADADEAAVSEATAKAEALLKEIRDAKGDNFAEVAKRDSQDPGSAQSGGDLGFFTADAMVAPFSEAVFSMTEGDISEIVRSDFGLHIIQVTGVRPEQVRPFDEVKDAIESELREQESQRAFAHAAETFSNVVYEQPDSLEPAATEFKLEIQHADWISRDGVAESPFDNRRLVGALFEADALERKLNTEAVDVGNGRLVSARVEAFEPERTEAVGDVREEIVARLKLEAASREAAKAGEALIEKLRAGGEAVDLEFGEVQTVTRASTELDPSVHRALFSLVPESFPVYGGVVAMDNDYVVYRIDSAKKPEIADEDPRLVAVKGQYERVLAERDLTAFLAELRRKYKVEINRAALQSVAS